MPVCTRRIAFDAGHRVLRHESKCRNVHGHRYVADITVTAPELDAIGRVVDFGVVKEFVGGWVDSAWDHGYIGHPDDPLLSIIEKRGLKVYRMPSGCNPTAESMAEVLGIQAQELLPDLIVSQVRLYETPNCWADWSPQG